MVKQAEKVQRRNPLMPVFGLIIVVGLFALAYGLEDIVVKLLNSLLTRLGMNASINLPPPPDLATNAYMSGLPLRLLIAFGIWLVLLIFAYTFVAIVSGKDPNSVKGMPMPPRTKEERDRRY